MGEMRAAVPLRYILSVQLYHILWKCKDNFSFILRICYVLIQCSPVRESMV